MDALWVGLVIGLALLSWGFVHLCDELRGRS